MAYKNVKTTNSFIMVIKIQSGHAPERIIHIAHNSRLFKLADFIFYLYRLDLDAAEFGFYYLDKGVRSYGGYSSFKLKHKNKSLPPRVGNMRHARIDSAFFSLSCVGLKVENNVSEEYVLEHLRTEKPKSGRRYPFAEILSHSIGV